MMNISLDELNQVLKMGFTSTLGIIVTKVGNDKIIATAPISENSYRPGGLVHGGVYLALAETLAGAGSFLSVDVEKYDVLGIQVSANHTGSARTGKMHVVATCIRRGRKTHIWNVDIFNNDKLLSTARVTNMIVEKA